MSLANHLAVDLTRFPDSDGVPLDSAWERDAINLLVHLTRQWFHDRDNPASLRPNPAVSKAGERQPT